MVDEVVTSPWLRGFLDLECFILSGMTAKDTICAGEPASTSLHELAQTAAGWRRLVQAGWLAADGGARHILKPRCVACTGRAAGGAARSAPGSCPPQPTLASTYPSLNHSSPQPILACPCRDGLHVSGAQQRAQHH